MVDLIILAPIGSTVALLFVGYLVITILKKPEGTENMIEISKAIRVGAKTYLKRQYKSISIFFAFMVVLLSILAWYRYLTPFVPFAFLSGGFYSGLAGYIGMSIATKSNARTAEGAKHSLNSGLRIAFSSGAVMGLVVVGLALLDFTFWYYFLNWYYSSIEICATLNERVAKITSAMITFGMGASSMALFARVGGGIYTKAADVGSDLVGKVEKGIPEDDPRNPAVIADQVGDNVGDVAGMGADLYESYVGAIVSTTVLAVAAGLSLQGVTTPVIIAVVGVIASIIGILCVRTSEERHRKILTGLMKKGIAAKEETHQRILLWALRKGIFLTAILVAIFSYFAVKYTLPSENINVYWAVLSGLIAGIAIGLNTEYFTSANYLPTQSISESAKTGSSTVIISGLSVGMLSAALPILIVSIATMCSYFLAGGATNPNLGLYGVGISAVGMLSTLGITLATDAYGPVADNAGGIAQFTNQPSELRERTDSLDALGNTTAATGKGFAIGSAALTALALIAAYNDKIKEVLGVKELALSLLNPRIIVGLLIGAVLPFIFCALTMRAVGRAASKIVLEVRRQFEEIPGLSEGNAKPDYGKCVDITTKSAQKEMVIPSLMAVIAPISVGVLLGLEAEVGLLVGALCSGFVLAVFMANSGGAWDNAKKYIEGGRLGGKGSLAHKASVIGDTVGDPFKDTAGPSLNILIKLMSIVSLVFASVIATHKIW